MAIPLVMLLALLLLGSLAAAVFALVYAIANKRPGVALAAVLVPVGAVVTLGVLAALFVGSARVAVHSSTPASVEWTGMPPMPAMPAMPAMPPMPGVPSDFRFMGVGGAVLASLVKVAVVLLICFGVVQLFRMRSGCKGERRGGWGKAIVVGLLLVLMAGYFMARIGTHRMSVAHGQVEAQRDLDQQIRLDVERAQLQAIEIQRKADEAQEEAAKHRAIEFKSIQELWEKFNQPRIKLESDEHGASMTVGEGQSQIEMVTPVDGTVKVNVSLADKTPESMARSLARLERIVEQVSAVADQVSDAGTLVGKAMIALNETMDSRQLPALPASTVASKQTVPPTPQIEEAQTHAEEEIQESYSSLKLVSESHDETEPEVANSRPSWIDDPPKRVGDTWRQVVVAGEYATDDECNRVADIYLLLVTFNHLQQLIGGSLQDESLPVLTLQGDNVFADGKPIVLAGQPADYRLSLAEMGIGVDYIRRKIAQKDFRETVERSFGPMKRLYTLVEFTPTVDAELRQRWDEYRRQERFAVVGAGAGSVLGLISLAFGLLKVDTWTKGYYTKRLFLGVPAAIIGLVGLLGLAAG